MDSRLITKSLLLFLGGIFALFQPLHAECSLELLESLVRRHAPEDQILREYIPHFPIETYEIVNSRSLGIFLVEKESQDMIKKVIREGWHREWHIAQHFRKYIRPGSVVVDIGAHIGTHTATFSHVVGDQGRVYAFEPQLKIFSELLLNMELNGRRNISFHRVALGNTNQWVEMNPHSDSNEGGISVGMSGDRVEMMKLDDFHLKNVSIIKIDVEGYEMEVLAGARETIRKNRPVIFLEIMGHVGYESASPADKAAIESRIHEVEKMGYKVTYLGIADFLFIPK